MEYLKDILGPKILDWCVLYVVVIVMIEHQQCSGGTLCVGIHGVIRGISAGTLPNAARHHRTLVTLVFF